MEEEGDADEEEEEGEDPEVQFHRAVTAGLARLTVEVSPPKGIVVCPRLSISLSTNSQLDN